MSRATLPEVREGYFPHWKLKTTGVIMPEERLPWGQTIVSGLQHGVAMAGGTIIAPLIMGFDPNRALLFSGLGTLIFFAVVAGRVPSYLGSSFSFVAVVITASSYSGHGPNLEAIDQFRRGLALVEALSDPREQADSRAGFANGARPRAVRDQGLQPPRPRPNLCAGVGALSAAR